jgi:hypothetical protein
LAINGTMPAADIADGLRKLRSRWRGLCVAAFTLWVAGSAALALCVALAVGSALPPSLGPLLLLAWLAATAYAVARVWSRTLGTRPNLDGVAARVEDTRPQARQALLGALQLSRRRDELTREGYDPGLLDMAIARGGDAMPLTDPREALGRERAFALKGGVVAFVGLAAVLGAWALGLASAEALESWITLPRGSSPVVVTAVRPGDTSVVAGERLEVTATLDRAPDDDVTIETREVGGEWQQIAMSTSSGGHIGSIRGIVAPMEYRVATGPVVSSTYQVGVLTAPAPDGLTLTLTFPEYTRLATKTLEPGHGDVTAVVGTRVTMTGSGGVALESASLQFENAAEAALTVDGAAFSGSFLVGHSDRYTVRLVSADDLENQRVTRYVVHAIRDDGPSVTVLVPGEDSTLDKSMVLPITVEASDDFGVSDLTLHYDHAAKDATGQIRIASYSPARPLARVSHDWDLGGLGLFAGDTVSYYVEARDNDTVNGPNRGVSPTYTARLPSLVEMFRQVAESQDAQTDMLGSLADAQDEVNDLVDSVMDRVRKSQELTLSDEKDIERALQMEEEIDAKREVLAAEMAKSLQEANRNSLLSVETLEQVAEMHRLLDDVASEELKQAMDKLREALEQESMAAQERDLMAADFDQEQFRERIEQMVQLLEKMKREQQLEKAFMMAEELAEQQQQVVEQTEAMNRELEGAQPEPGSEEARDSERLAEREARIAEQTDELRQQLDTAEQALREDDDLSDVADEAQRLADEMDARGIQEQLNEAGGEFAQSNPQGAQPPASQALRELQFMRQQLDNAMEFMRGQGGEALQAALTDAMREMLHLSRSHEDLADAAVRRLPAGQRRAGTTLKPQGVTSKEHGDLALGEQIVADGVNAVASALQQLSQEDTQIPLEIMFHLRDAADAVGRSSMAFAEGELVRAPPIQRDALAKLNRVALEMLDALNALNAQMGGSGMQSMMEQMQQLGEGQGDLNQMTQQLEQMMREQGQSPGMQESLRRMAFEQSLIREAFERIEEQMRAMEEGLGDLGGLEGEMEAVEGELGAAEVNRDVLERMRRIETRMLESAKALQKRQTGKSRKAKIAERIFGLQEGVERDEWSQVRDQFGEKLLRSADADAPEAYRAQVRAYFRALADTGGGLE